MRRVVRFRLRVVESGLVSTEAEIAESQQMGGVAAAGLVGVETTCVEEGVFQQAVVEVVVYEVPQLGIDAHGRRHGEGGRGVVGGAACQITRC